MAKKNNNKPAAKTAPVPVVNRAEEKKVTTPGKSMSLRAKLCLLLAVVSLLVYGNTLRNGYVLDDAVVTIKNSIVTQGFKGIPELMVTPRMKGVGYFKNDNYRPLTLSMFAAEYEIFGPNPAAGHFFNILFFAGSVVLLFLFIDKLFERKKMAVAFITALLFALHPIHTEVVANIKSRDEICCFFFAFASINLYMNYMEKGKMWQLLAGVLLMFLSFLSKETVITFLFIVPLVFFLYRNDDKKKAIFILVGAGVAAAVYLIIRNRVLSEYDTSTTAIEFIDNSLAKAPNMMVRLGTAMLVMGWYLKLLVLPYPLNCDYAYDTIPFVGFGDIRVIVTTLIYLALGVFALYRLVKGRKDPWAFAILFFMATISLLSNLIFLTGSQMGERFLYFASVGFCLAIALAIEKWILKSDSSMEALNKNKLAIGILLPVALIYSGLTFARNNDWKSNYELYKTDQPKSPNDCRLYFYLGDEMVENMYNEEKDPEKQKQILKDGIALMNKAIQIYPQYTDVYTELGKAHLMLNEYDSAIYNFKIAISQSPYQSIAANNLGTTYMRMGKYLEAIDAYKLALSINPGFPAAFFNIGCCYIQVQQLDSAVSNLNKALSLDPNYLAAYMQMGVAYYYMNKPAEAEQYIKKALSADPNNVDALNTLGAIYQKMQRYSEAIQLLQKAISINPNYVNAYSNLAHCYFETKQYQATIETVTKLLSLNPKAVNEIPYIALSYKGLGNMAEAKRYEAISQQYFREFKL